MFCAVPSFDTFRSSKSGMTYSAQTSLYNKRIAVPRFRAVPL
jgi:hypothetical protein